MYSSQRESKITSISSKDFWRLLLLCIFKYPGVIVTGIWVRFKVRFLDAKSLALKPPIVKLLRVAQQEAAGNDVNTCLEMNKINILH